MLVMLCVCFWVVFADYLSMDLYDYTSPVLIVHLCLYLGILNMLMCSHTQVTVVYIDLFGSVSTQIILPSEVK